MRLIVTGKQGQVARALRECAGPDLEIVTLGRPELDLSDPTSVSNAFEGQRADVVVSAAAYTAVDKADSEEALATAINGRGAGEIAAAAARMSAPVIHLSTDYVFDGALARPYREDDPTGPVSAYGRSKLAGERAVAEANSRCAILRTAWVYSPFGANFVKTMLRLGETRRQINVVADQRGCPTSALDIAAAVIAVARNLATAPSPDRFGVFHMTGAGEATWAEFAAAIFAEGKRHGRPPVEVLPIPTSQYPTPAKRPANSRLEGDKLASAHSVRLPEWRASLRTVVERLLAAPAA